MSNSTASCSADRAAQLESDLHELTASHSLICAEVSRAYEELSLLYRVIRNLHRFGRIEDLLQHTVEWLSKVVAAEYVEVRLDLHAGEFDRRPPGHRGTTLRWGRDLEAPETLAALMEKLDLSARSGPRVVNRTTAQVAPEAAEIRQLVAVPLARGDHMFGWIAVVNHSGGEAFGTVEASLIHSVAALIGLHSDNLEMYHRQVVCLADKQSADQKAQELADEVESLSRSLSETYDEIELLHELSHCQPESDNPGDLGHLVVRWLARALPVEGVVLQMDNLDGEAPQTFARGQLPVEVDRLRRWVETLDLSDYDRPLVLCSTSDRPDRWPDSRLKQLMVAPFRIGQRRLGWLAALNHRERRVLGSLEAKLMSTVCSILTTRSP